MRNQLDVENEQNEDDLEFKIDDEQKTVNKAVNRKLNLKSMIFSCIYGLLLIIQIILVFFFYNHEDYEYLTWIGWSLLIPFCIFGRLPVLEFKKHGDVEDGKSYVYTTKLVTSGVYSIVRHPQFLSFILLSLSMIFLSQIWIQILLGAIVTISTYLEAWQSDKNLIRKFGEEYKAYMNKVPRMNFIWGSIKAIWYKRK